MASKFIILVILALLCLFDGVLCGGGGGDGKPLDVLPVAITSIASCGVLGFLFFLMRMSVRRQITAEKYNATGKA